MGNKSRLSYRLATTAAAGEHGILSRRLSSDGTIEKVTVRFYVGQELNLRLRLFTAGLNEHENPVLQLDSTKKVFDVNGAVTVTAKGKAYLDGDDDKNIYDITIPVGVDEEVCVEYWNLLDPADPAIVADPKQGQLNFFVEYEVDHLGGKEVVR